MRGPIDFIVVGFEGKEFDGSVIQTLEEPIKNGVISVVALTAIRKDADGNVERLDVADLGDDYLIRFTETNAPAVADQADIDEVADLLENNTAAAILIVEQLWAKPLKQALIDAKGVLVAEGRIHPDAATELN